MHEPELKIIDVLICKLANASGAKIYIETVWDSVYPFARKEV
jgi:hypothetical protein